MSTGFAFIDKGNGNVDYIMSWNNLDELPAGYPLDSRYTVVKIANYIVGAQGYECYDGANFGKRLIVMVDKNRTLIDGIISITIKYPSTAVNEVVHLTIGDTTQDVYVVNGQATYSYTATTDGNVQIKAESSTHYGLNYANIEIFK